MTDLKFELDYKYNMIHPYIQYQVLRPIDKIPRYDMTLKMCTLYKGVPYGIAQISFKHPTEDWNSFEGVGVFTDGRLHMGPFTCL